MVDSHGQCHCGRHRRCHRFGLAASLGTGLSARIRRCGHVCEQRRPLEVAGARARPSRRCETQDARLTRRADGGGGGEQLPRAVRAAAWARPRAAAGGAGGARAQRRGGDAGQGQAAGVRGRAPKRDGDDRRAAGAGPAVRGPAAAARRRSAGPGARPPSSFCLSFLCSASVQPHGLPPQLLQGALASRGAAAQFASPGLRYV